MAEFKCGNFEKGTRDLVVDKLIDGVRSLLRRTLYTVVTIEDAVIANAWRDSRSTLLLILSMKQGIYMTRYIILTAVQTEFHVTFHFLFADWFADKH